MIFAANIVSMDVLKKKTKTRFYLLWQKSNRIMDYYRAAEIFGLESSIWKFWGTVSATMSFIVVLVNTLLLHTFIKNPLLRNRKHMMVVNLAVADLIYGLLGIPSLIFSIFNPTPISIIVSSGMITFTKSACLFTLSVIAVERMYSVVWPIRHKLMNSKAYKVAVLAIWIFSMGNTTLSIYRRDKVSKFSPFLQPAALFVIVIITSTCYLRIWITLRRRGQCRIGTAARQDRSLALTLLPAGHGSFLGHVGNSHDLWANLPVVQKLHLWPLFWLVFHVCNAPTCGTIFGEPNNLLLSNAFV